MVLKSNDKNSFKYYDLLLGFSVATLLISNIVAVKLISFGPIIIDGGLFIFPIVYVLGDVITEVYGYTFTRRAIWASFIFMILAVVIFELVGYAPAATQWSSQSSYDAILGFVPRIVLASLTAYLCGQFLNAYILAKMKVNTKGKKLWLRLVGSTMVAEFIDTLIFALIAFGGLLQGYSMIKFILIGWLFKTILEIIMLPITYKIIYYLKRAEKSDKFDSTTNFSPFNISI
jgi:uncharacterized integral membrane protein (TIGR00697 family)